MDVRVAMNMTHDEIKSKYKEYLRLQALSKNTVQTASNDTFYLRKNESKELFWEKILSPDFETVYRTAMVESLSKRTKGDPQKLIWCEITDGELKLLEAESARWLTRENLYEVPWLPADLNLIKKVATQMENVKYIARIVIKGASGYGSADEAYNDKVTITPTSISYEYKPMYESELNLSRKWSYKTNSPIFRMMYDKVAGMLPAIIERGIQEFCTDIGGIEFNITYSDKTKFKEITGSREITLKNCLWQ